MLGAVDRHRQLLAGRSPWSPAPPGFPRAAVRRLGWLANPRANLMAALVVLWGVRLTWNFRAQGRLPPWRRGSPSWPEVRRALGPIGFQALNLTFIAPFQNLLLLPLALPTYARLARGARSRSARSTSWPRRPSSLRLGEAIADQQQWRFQCAKRAGGDAATAGFSAAASSGYSRHPNFFCEIASVVVLLPLRRRRHSPAAGSPATSPAPRCSPCSSRARPTSPSASRSASTPTTHYQRTTSRLVPWWPRPAGL
ncbi:MAG: DUF1295 domain-containing protein [Dehalococcoidia bacterium]